MTADERANGPARALRLCALVAAALSLQGCPEKCEDGDCDRYPHDLAVLKLDVSPASLDATAGALLRAVPPIELAPTDSWSPDDHVAIVGFGVTQPAGLDTPIKREALVYAKNCNSTAYAEHVCFAVEVSGAGNCGGDSGGPMLMSHDGRLVLIGVASETTASCLAGEGIYEDVTRQEHGDWIRSKLSTYVAVAGLELRDATPIGASHGAVLAGQPDPSVDVTVNDAPHLAATLNFPRQKKENNIILQREFQLSLSSGGTNANCTNDDAAAGTVRYCHHAPTAPAGWTATVARGTGDPGPYQLVIATLENTAPAPP